MAGELQIGLQLGGGRQARRDLAHGYGCGIHRPDVGHLELVDDVGVGVHRGAGVDGHGQVAPLRQGVQIERNVAIEGVLGGDLEDNAALPRKPRLADRVGVEGKAAGVAGPWVLDVVFGLRQVLRREDHREVGGRGLRPTRQHSLAEVWVDP